jgi:hypothetical protein
MAFTISSQSSGEHTVASGQQSAWGQAGIISAVSHSGSVTRAFATSNEQPHHLAVGRATDIERPADFHIAADVEMDYSAATAFGARLRAAIPQGATDVDLGPDV